RLWILTSCVVRQRPAEVFQLEPECGVGCTRQLLPIGGRLKQSLTIQPERFKFSADAGKLPHEVFPMPADLAQAQLVDEALAETSEVAAYLGQRRVVRVPRKQRSNRFRKSVQRLGADIGNAKPVAVEELKRRELCLDFLPVLPDAEVGAKHVRVVEQDDAAIAHLRPPRLEVGPNGFVSVQAV